MIQANSYGIEDSWCQLEDLDFFDLSKYTFQGLIGSSNAPVYRYQNINSTEDILALKELKIRDPEDYQRTVENMKTLQRIKQNSHPYIIKIYGFCKGIKKKVYGEDISAFLVMEYCEGNLDDFIQMRKNQNKMFTAAEVAQFFAQTVSALEYLQTTLNIAHRDIKPENILIHNSDFKIADLDDSKIDLNKTIEKSLVLGTVSFMAPELLKAYLRMKDRLSYNAYRSDVYSLGLCLLYMCTFEKFSRSERIEEEKGRYASKIKQLRQKVKNDYGVLLSKLIKIMLDNDPWKRPDFSTLKETAINKTYLEREDFNFQKETPKKKKKTSVEFTFPQMIASNNNGNNCCGCNSAAAGVGGTIHPLDSPQLQGDVFSMAQSKQLEAGWPILNLQPCNDDQIASTVGFAAVPILSQRNSGQQIQEISNANQNNVTQLNEQDRSRTKSDNSSYIQSRTYSHLSNDQRNDCAPNCGSFYTESDESDIDNKRKSTFTASAIIRYTKHSKDLWERDESSESIQQCENSNNQQNKAEGLNNLIPSKNSQDRLRECPPEKIIFDNNDDKKSNSIILNSDQFLTQKLKQLYQQQQQQQEQQQDLFKNGIADPDNSSSNREIQDGEEEDQIYCTPSSVNMIESLMKGGLAKEKQKRRQSSRGLSDFQNWNTREKLNSLTKQRKIFSVVIAVMVLASIGLGIAWLVLFSQTDGNNQNSGNQPSTSTNTDENNNNNSNNLTDISLESCQRLGKYYLNGQCLAACPQVGYFPITDRGICVECDDSCLQCTKGEPNFCTKCKEQFYLLSLSSGAGLCLSDCPNSFRKDDKLNKCLKCPENCLNCASNSQNSTVRCLQCVSQYFLYGDNLCVTVCPKGTIVDFANNLCSSTTTFEVNRRFRR